MKNVGVSIGIFFLGFAVIILYQSTQFSYYGAFGPGPGFFPIWLSGILLVLSVLLIVQSSKKHVVLFKDVLPKGKELRIVLKIFASIILFIIIVSYTGFIIAGTLVLFLLYFPEYKWYSALWMSAATASIVFIVFKVLLNIPLPVNALGI